MIKETSLNDVVIEKLNDLLVPGFMAEVSPDEAEVMGIFSENALSEEDAKEASYD